jgi:hypothetical protein
MDGDNSSDLNEMGLDNLIKEAIEQSYFLDEKVVEELDKTKIETMKDGNASSKAYDSRYFISLWNVVIIPAWINSFMDKINSEKDSPAEIIQATFKNICDILYSKIPEILTTIPKVEGSPCRGTYNINVICPKNNNCANPGEIIKKLIVI